MSNTEVGAQGFSLSTHNAVVGDGLVQQCNDLAKCLQFLQTAIMSLEERLSKFESRSAEVVERVDLIDDQCNHCVTMTGNSSLSGNASDMTEQLAMRTADLEDRVSQLSAQHETSAVACDLVKYSAEFSDSFSSRLHVMCHSVTGMLAELREAEDWKYDFMLAKHSDLDERACRRLDTLEKDVACAVLSTSPLRTYVGDASQQLAARQYDTIASLVDELAYWQSWASCDAWHGWQ